MMENGFSSPRSEAFPAGLRVLVVDDDLTWLKILEKMLKKCSYEVTTCSLAIEALNLLRGRKGGYDIVISDVNMPDMDGFKLLELVGLEMELPVIMMSVDGEMRRVMRGVQHGACDYLLKPIRMKELRNIWQHVFRRKIHEVRDMESHEVLQLMTNGYDQTEDSLFLSGEDLSSVKKRKNVDDFGDSSSSSKKPRVVWTVELHQKFVEAVNKIGLDKVGPKRILDAMEVPWLSRENVASHLQKYRLYLSRLQKENGTKHKDLKFSLQNSINSHQNDAANGKLLDAERAFIGDDLVLPMAGTSELGFINPLASLESEILYAAFDSTNPEILYAAFDSTNPIPYHWDDLPEIQFNQDHEPFLHLQYEDSLSHPHERLYDEFSEGRDLSEVPLHMYDTH